MLKYKSTWILYFTCVVVAIVTRVIQLIYMTEVDTGFLKPDFQQAGLLIGIGLIFMLLLIGFFAFTSDRFPVQLPQGSKPLAVFSFLAAAGQIYEIISSSGISDKAVFALYSILLLLSAVFFVFFGISQLIPIKIPNMLTLVPTVTMVVKLIWKFMRYTGMANISENLFDIGMLIFLTLFFLWMGKILNNMTSKYNLRVMFATGLIASLFCFVCTLPRYFIIMFGMGNVLHTESLPNPADVAIGLFIIAFLIEYFSQKNLEYQQQTDPQFPDTGSDFYVG